MEPEAPEELEEGAQGELLTDPSLPTSPACLSLRVPRPSHGGGRVLSPPRVTPFPTDPPELGYEELVRRNVVGAGVGTWG